MVGSSAPFRKAFDPLFQAGRLKVVDNSHIQQEPYGGQQFWRHFGAFPHTLMRPRRRRRVIDLSGDLVVPHPKPFCDLNSTIWTGLEAIIRRFEEEWKAGRRPTI